MKIFTSEIIKQDDRAVIQAIFGRDKNIEWVVFGSRPVVDSNSVLTELDYIGNPDGTIRWLYPTRSRRPLFLSTYTSPSKKAAFYRKGIQIIFRLGLARVARSGRMFIQHTPEANIAALPIKVSMSNYAVFTGTVGPNRKAVIALADRERVVEFAKVAVGPQASLHMKYEIHAQKKVATMKLESWRVPSGCSISAETTLQENIAPPTTQISSKLSHLHLRAIKEMTLATLSYEQSARNSFLTRVQDRLRAIERGPSLAGMPRLVEQLQSLFQEASAMKRLPICYSHGDFTPWNLFPSETRLRAYDWELAGYRPALFDCIHFVFQNAVLVDRLSYAEIRSKIEMVFQHESMQKLIDSFDLKVEQLLRLYLLENVISNLRLFQKQGDLHAQAWWLMRVWAEALESECQGKVLQSARTHFLQEFPSILGETKYAFMRGGEEGLMNLPFESDLDILLTQDDQELLYERISEHPLVLKMCRFRQSFMDRLEIHLVDGTFLSLDLITDLRRKALRMMSATVLLERAVQDQFGIRRLLLEDQLEYAILFYGLNNHPIPQKYAAIIEKLSGKRREAFAERLATTYGFEKNVSSLVHDLENSPPQLRKRLKGLELNDRSKRVRLNIQYYADLIRRWCSGNGMVITFSGVDGAGKSTVIEATAKAVGQAYRRKVKVLRHRPSVLPIISALRYGKKAAEDRSTSQLPRQGTNRNMLSSLLRFAWYFTDYVLGQWYIWLFFQRRGYVVLYDRYYFDMIADPERSNMRLPAFIVEIAGKLVRKPDLNFLLTADPETIRARKQELPLKDIQSLTQKYRQLFQKLSQRKSRAQYFSLHNLGIEESVERVICAYRKAL